MDIIVGFYDQMFDKRYRMGQDYHIPPQTTLENFASEEIIKTYNWSGHIFEKKSSNTDIFLIPPTSKKFEAILPKTGNQQLEQRTAHLQD